MKITASLPVHPSCLMVYPSRPYSKRTIFSLIISDGAMNGHRASAARKSSQKQLHWTSASADDDPVAVRAVTVAQGQPAALVPPCLHPIELGPQRSVHQMAPEPAAAVAVPEGHVLTERRQLQIQCKLAGLKATGKVRLFRSSYPSRLNRWAPLRQPYWRLAWPNACGDDQCRQG